jgi:hypothetical protein
MFSKSQPISPHTSPGRQLTQDNFSCDECFVKCKAKMVEAIFSFIRHDANCISSGKALLDEKLQLFSILQ